MSMSSTELTICFAAGVLLSLGLTVVATIYFHRKRSEERRLAVKEDAGSNG